MVRYDGDAVDYFGISSNCSYKTPTLQGGLSKSKPNPQFAARYRLDFTDSAMAMPI
jgi:hypothetical protein